jgi:hypothetical protein
MTDLLLDRTPIDPRRRYTDYIAAVPDLGMAAFCLLLWIRPEIPGPGMIRTVTLVMLLEFIVIHSAAFMGSVALGGPSTTKLLKYGRVKAVIGLGLFYTLFVAGFALAFGTWWPIVAFWVLTFNRLLGSILAHEEPTDIQKKGMLAGWAIGAVAYLMGAMVTTIGPVPRFGITDAVVSAAELPGEGIWIDEPYRAVALAVIYFGVIGWYELSWRRIVRRMPE